MSEQELVFVPDASPAHVAGQEIQYNPPEILANPPLPNTKLIYSTPVFNEWRNGNLLKHVRAVLSQRLNDGVAIESNYIINMGGSVGHKAYPDQGPATTDWDAVSKDPLTAESYEDSQNSLTFLKKVINVQKLARLIQLNGGIIRRFRRREYQNELKVIIEQEQDPLVQEVLKLATEKSSSVAISSINTLMPREVDYRYSGIAGLRTSGMDYAAKRSDNPECIFFMYDCDTVPEDNRFTQEVIDIYDQYPDINYLFTNLSYQPAGESIDVVASSPKSSLERIFGYNLYRPKGSPQISFRQKVMVDIQRVTDMGWQDDEDRDTALRLGLFYSDMQDGILTRAAAIIIPTSLTSDRISGTVDSFGRKMGLEQSGVGDIYKAFPRLVEEQATLLQKISDVQDPGLREQLDRDFDIVRKEYQRRQRIQLKFNRLVVSQFLQALQVGEILVRDDQLQVDAAKVMNRNAGRALASYLHANKDFIRSLTKEDLDYMNYLLGKGQLPTNLKKLTPLQLALREYLGEFTDVNQIQLDSNQDSRGVDNRQSYLHPLVAETLAMSDIYYRYLYAHDIRTWRKDYVEEHHYSPRLEDSPFEERSAQMTGAVQGIPSLQRVTAGQVARELFQKLRFPLAAIFQINFRK